MAFAVRITGLRSIYDQDAMKDKEVFEMEPSWWSTDELKKDPRFLKTRDLGSYDDYTVDLPAAEVVKLLEQYWPVASATGGASDSVLESNFELEKVLTSGE